MSEQRSGSRKPPGAIAPIATLPVFFKLRDRRAVVAGGTAPAAWKAELLAAAGARVLVLASQPCPEMEQLAEAMPDRLMLLRRSWVPDDLTAATIAIGAFEGDEGEPFRDAARMAGVPVNIIDVPRLCDFQFGTIVARTPLVIGISTDGAAPVFGQALRARIEALLPMAVGAWLAAATTWRRPLQDMNTGFSARRRFWETFSDLAFAAGDREPDDADRRQCIAAAETAERSSVGKIILVGVGAGSLDGVTLGAVRALQSADVVVCEPDVPSGILSLARREARRQISEPMNADTPQAVEAIARNGRTVAWVGLGDATTAEVWRERRSSLLDPAIPIEIVPGLPC